MKKTIYTLFLLFSFLSVAFLNQTNIAFANVSEILQPNAFRLIRQVSSDGQIAMAYVFPVNSSILAEKGFTVSEITTFKFYLTSYVNMLAKNNKEKSFDGVKISNAQYFSDVDGIGFSMVFESLDAQSKFFGISNTQQGDSSKSSQQSSGFFIKTICFKTNFPFSQNSAGDLKMVVLMAVSSWANDQNMTEDEKQNVQQILNSSTFIYDFASAQTSLKSEIMYDDENFHHNVFIKTYDQLKSTPEILFFTKQINTPVWYGMALFLVISVMIVVYLILKYKKKRD